MYALHFKPNATQPQSFIFVTESHNVYPFVFSSWHVETFLHTIFFAIFQKYFGVCRTVRLDTEE